MIVSLWLGLREFVQDFSLIQPVSVNLIEIRSYLDFVFAENMLNIFAETSLCRCEVQVKRKNTIYC